MEQISKEINEEFEAVRQWGEKRGLKGTTPQMAYQKVLQEVAEIHEAITLNDKDEIIDSIGDAIVTIINIAKSVDLKAEHCLRSAFNVIELRKGLYRDGLFVRYGKLSDADKKICDEKQGNPGNEYYIREQGETFTPEDFLA